MKNVWVDVYWCFNSTSIFLLPSIYFATTACHNIPHQGQVEVNYKSARTTCT